MVSLTKQKENSHCRVSELRGTTRFISRITSIGLTTGTIIEVIQNRRNHPLLLFARDTMIAVSKKEAQNIFVEEVK